MEEPLRAYDWIRLADQIREQLDAARAKLAEAGDHAREQSWLNEATELLTQDGEAREKLLSRARRLPELASVRQEHAADLIGPWVDALEHLHAGIVFNAGLRSPLIEALFPHRKFDVLRRGNVDAAQAYGTDFQRRLSSSYLERMLAREEFAFAKPSVEEVTSRFAALAQSGEEALEESEARSLIAELSSRAQEVEVAIKQARLLAEASLVPVPGFFEELAMRSKPKTRSAPKSKEAAASEPPPPAEAAPSAPKPKKEKAPAKSQEKAPAKAKEKAEPKKKVAAKPPKKRKAERTNEASA